VNRFKPTEKWAAMTRPAIKNRYRLGGKASVRDEYSETLVMCPSGGVGVGHDGLANRAEEHSIILQELPPGWLRANFYGLPLLSSPISPVRVISSGLLRHILSAAEI
jgi:hypothetical protein